MRKEVLLTLLFGFAAFASRAQNVDDVRYDSVQVVRRGEQIDISFTASIGSHCIGRKGKFLFTPVLFEGDYTLALPSISVFSRHAGWIEFREELSKKHPAGDGSSSPIIYRSSNNGQVAYHTSIAWQPGLTHVGLRMERILRTSRKKPLVFPAILLTGSRFQLSLPVVPPPVIPPLPRPTADSLAECYPFLVPLSDLKHKQGFDPNMPLRMGKETVGGQQEAVNQFIAANEEGSLCIRFGRSRSAIERYYQENNTSLVTLVSVLRQVASSADSRVVRIAIAGFSSPEGPLAENNRLAWERADAVRRFIVENTNVRFDQIQLYNGSEDWRGLRNLVEQTVQMGGRYEVLRIIDTVPILSGREKQLMDVAGGAPYRYMKRYLFPQLRNAAFIKVYYTNL